jgi:hypothetical protein
MNTRQEKLLQVLVMVLTFVFGIFASRILTDISVYPMTVLTGPFVAGLVFVVLTRRTRRHEMPSIALSVVGTLGFGAIGAVNSTLLDDATPYDWLLWCHDRLWGPLGDLAYLALLFVFFVMVPIGFFILGRTLGERLTALNLKVA